ncbi:MAG: ESPR domain-containing protein, partial [Sutterella wadsworthensis]
MNSTFKVVFNKARGALMVVNEVTSSVQAKGTKTVVAAAVATMIAGVAGTAMAEEAAEPSEPAAKTTIVINNATTPNDLTKYAAMDFDGYVSSNASGHLGGAVLINGGQTVAFHDGVKFTNNTSEKSGGAIEVQAGTVTLKDAVITGNKADSWGGAIRMAGKSTVNLTVTKDTVYSGNKANANGKLDYPDMGDFVYMNGATNGQKTALNLKAEGDATLTVADSIASAGSNNEITTEGKVNVTGSMEAYTGDISVETGTFKLAGGFGSYDLWTTSNGAKKNSNAVAKLTVKEKAAAELGALTITRTSQDSNKKSIAGTELVVEQGGKLTVESITVTSQQYVNKDKKLDWTSHGWGKLENKGGEATVKDHITVE